MPKIQEESYFPGAALLLKGALLPWGLTIRTNV